MLAFTLNVASIVKNVLSVSFQGLNAILSCILLLDLEEYISNYLWKGALFLFKVTSMVILLHLCKLVKVCKTRKKNVKSKWIIWHKS